MSEEIQITKDAQERLMNLAERTKIPLKDLEDEFRGRVREFGIKFSSEGLSEERVLERNMRLAMASFWRDYIERPPVDSFTVIPLGFSGSRKSQAGNMTATLFAIIKGERGIQRITCQGSMADKVVKTVSLFDQYVDVKLGKFKNGGFSADDRAKFESPNRLDISPEEMLNKIGVTTRTTIEDASKNASHVRSDGYVDSTDWRIIRGMISKKWVRERKERKIDKEGKETQKYVDSLATYTITDDSILYGEPVVVLGKDGNEIIQAPGFTCWIAPELQIYEVDDECDFIGSISYYKKGDEYQMNCYLVLPVHTTSGSPDMEGE